jgi:hypothetical protein
MGKMKEMYIEEQETHISRLEEDAFLLAYENDNFTRFLKRELLYTDEEIDKIAEGLFEYVNG